MKKHIAPRSAAALAALALLLASPSAAQTFAKYVALGDSITASFQGLCLVTRNQNGSYPLLVSQQLGISGFQQPLFAEGPLTSSDANKCLGFVVNGNSIGVGPVSDQLSPTNITLPRPYDNLGIPGATAEELLTITSADPAGNTANKFGYAILRNNFPGNAFGLNGTNAVQQALALSPDLVTLWAGSNDVLGALLYAVALDGVTMTPVSVFTPTYTSIIQSLQASGATIVTLNIPSVDAVPFANTIPPVVVDPSTGQPVIVNGGPVPLLGPGDAAYPCPAGVPACPLPPGTLVTLAASSPQAALGNQSLLGLGFGIPCQVAPTLPRCGFPLPDGQFVPPATIVPGVLLYPDEVDRIRVRTQELNDVIASVGASAGAIPIDIHERFQEFATTGYHIGGLTFTTAFGTGGIFSADGFHPNNVAQAFLADWVVTALNEARNLQIPRPNLYNAIFTPNVPPGGAAATVTGFQYSEELLRQLYGIFHPVDASVAVQDDRGVILRPAPRPPHPQRTVDRPDDRDR